jgi:hydrogenase assembly chaperone HypC/HupF
MAIPAQVLEVKGERAKVTSEKQPMEVGRVLVPELDVGDWVLVNTGQVIARLTPEEAESIRQLLKEFQAFVEE